MASKGLFITFEGTEGVGKSTLVDRVVTSIQDKGLPVVLTREPGGSVVSEKIRTLILEMEMDPWTEIFLYEAARAEHISKKINPALAEGKIVICDRFTGSTLAYQGHARNLPWSKVKQLNELATGETVPHLNIWMDLDPEKGLSRATVETRFEREGIKFQNKVREGYQKAHDEDPDRWLHLPVEGLTPEELTLKVMKELTSRFPDTFNG